MESNNKHKDSTGLVKEIFHDWGWGADPRFIAEVTNFDEEPFAIQLHDNTGREIRNAYGLWKKDTDLYHHFVARGITEPDEMTHQLFLELHKYAREQIGTPTSVAAIETATDPEPPKILIAKPCSENWDDMKTENGGKFCESCQNHVFDFTDMSEDYIIKFFKDNAGKTICGRFKAMEKSTIDQITTGTQVYFQKSKDNGDGGVEEKKDPVVDVPVLGGITIPVS
jgi:hypothetical protein